MLMIFHFPMIIGKFYFSSLAENSPPVHFYHNKVILFQEGPLVTWWIRQKAQWLSQRGLSWPWTALTRPRIQISVFWYVQHLNKAPQLLLKGSMKDQKPKSEGFQATLVRTDSSFHLQKRAVQASDSAVYYCALSDTVREGCGGAEHTPRVQMGLWLWAALWGLLFLS